MNVGFLLIFVSYFRDTEMTIPLGSLGNLLSLLIVAVVTCVSIFGRVQNDARQDFSVGDSLVSDLHGALEVVWGPWNVLLRIFPFSNCVIVWL